MLSGSRREVELRARGSGLGHLSEALRRRARDEVKTSGNELRRRAECSKHGAKELEEMSSCLGRDVLKWCRDEVSSSRRGGFVWLDELIGLLSCQKCVVKC